MNEPPVVLIVDDEPMSREALEVLLIHERYRIETAEDGPGALAQAGRVKADVILLDVMMPGMDGFEVCSRLKADPQLRHIPVIMLTALTDRSSLLRGLDSGADEFLSKPVEGIELRGRVRGMLRIKRQHDELTVLLRAREELARLIVHDMRTPLWLITGQLASRDGKPSPALIRETVEAIAYQTGRLQQLTDDLLLTAKMEEGRLTLHIEPIDLAGLVRAVVASHEPVATQSGIRLVTEGSDAPCSGAADENLMMRVLDNLVSNAIKYAPENSTVAVRVQPADATGVIRLRVEDEGPGIPAADRPGIFDKFAIVELKKRGVTQVGLGLPFAKLVVEAHGGRIFVDGRRPRGSVFTVELPAGAASGSAVVKL
ncbi:MAG: response regulator [Candidatus Riflebacteria bacterium]|nr:response regulator [Candidatus Riflebacteria bacterium]